MEQKTVRDLALPWDLGPAVVAATLRAWARVAAALPAWSGLATAARYQAMAEEIHPLGTGKQSDLDRPDPAAAPE
jgi:hypothetical protein